MAENNTPENKNDKKPEKLKIIGPKQAVIYWIVAVLCILTVIFLYRYNKNNYKEEQSKSSSSASVIFELSDRI